MRRVAVGAPRNIRSVDPRNSVPELLLLDGLNDHSRLVQSTTVAMENLRRESCFKNPKVNCGRNLATRFDDG